MKDYKVNTWQELSPRKPTTLGRSSGQIEVPSDLVTEIVDASRTDSRRDRLEQLLNSVSAAEIMFCAFGLVAPLIVAGVGGGPEDVAGMYLSVVMTALLHWSKRNS